jgi:hypothetical protein
MAQMFRHYQNEDGNPNFDKYFIEDKPYRYEWTTVRDELKALSKLRGEDLSNRERFFNATTIIAMTENYLDQIERYVTTCTICPGNWRKRAYKPKRVLKYDVRETLGIIRKHTDNIFKCTDSVILNNDSYLKLYLAVKDFISACPIPVDLKKSNAWINAFKGSGAYYTMDNMIKFHDCHVILDGNTLDTDQSINQLNIYVIKTHNDYSKLFDIMTDFIEYNHFSFSNAMREKYRN